MASSVVQTVKNPPVNVGDPGSTPGSRRSPGEGKATHSSILVWRISGTKEPDRLQFTGLQLEASERPSIVLCLLLVMMPSCRIMNFSLFVPLAMFNWQSPVGTLCCLEFLGCDFSRSSSGDCPASEWILSALCASSARLSVEFSSDSSARS